MIIEPAIFQHPKFVHLKAEVGENALELLARLWAHCQQNKRGEFWPGANADYVEVVCTGARQRGRIYEALRISNWLHERDGGVEIHDWNEHNASLIARWKRDGNKPVQAPAQRSTQTPTQTATQPPAQTPDRIGGDRTGQDTRGEEPTLTPSLSQTIEYFDSNGSGYSRQQVEAVFSSFEATKHPDGWWMWGKSMVTDWRSAMSSRLLDRFQKKTGADSEKTGAGEPPRPVAAGKITLEQMKGTSA